MSERVDGIRARLAEAKKRFKEVAELYARKGNAEELRIAKADVDTVEAQLQAVEDLERERAEEMRAEQEKATAEAYRQARRERLDMSIRNAHGVYDNFLKCLKLTDDLGEAFRSMNKCLDGVTDSLQGFSTLFRVALRERLPAPLTLTQMLGVRLGLARLDVVAKFTPPMTGLQDREDARGQLAAVRRDVEATLALLKEE